MTPEDIQELIPDSPSMYSPNEHTAWKAGAAQMIAILRKRGLLADVPYWTVCTVCGVQFHRRHECSAASPVKGGDA